MTYYIRDVDDKTSDLDLDYDREQYGDNDAWESEVTPEQEQEALEIEASLQRESDFFKSYTDRGINPWEPATD